MNYKVCKKNAQGKFWGYGSIKLNKWGNPALSFKVTPELKEIFNSTLDGQWVNFSLFEDDKKEQPQAAANVDLQDEVPF